MKPARPVEREKAIKREKFTESQPGEDLVVGTLVFGKWSEKTTMKYWPGQIKAVNEACQKYLVLFYDGYEKELKRDEIMKACLLVPGNRVNVDLDEGQFQPGSINSFADCSSAGEIFYTVALDPLPNVPLAEAETKSVGHNGMHLSLEQWTEIRNEIKEIEPSKKVAMADVSLDNVICGKRKSKPLTPIKETTPRRKRGGSNVETSATETEISEMSEKKRQRKRVAAKRNENLPVTTTDDNEEKAKNDKTEMKKKGSAIFKNYIFLITQSTHRETEDFSAMDTETENDEDDDETLREEEVLNRAALKKQILEHGGHVLMRFPDREKEKIPSNVCKKILTILYPKRFHIVL